MPEYRTFLDVAPTGLDPEEEDAVVRAMEADAAESWRAVNIGGTLNLYAVIDRDQDR